MDKSILSKTRESSLMSPREIKVSVINDIFSSIDKFSTRPTDVSSSGKFFADVLLISSLSSPFLRPFSKDPEGPLAAIETESTGHGLLLHAGRY